MSLPANKFHNHPGSNSYELYNDHYERRRDQPELLIWEMINEFILSMQFSSSQESNIKFIF